MNKTIKTAFRIEENVKATIDSLISIDENITASDIMRNALDEYIKLPVSWETINYILIPFLTAPLIEKGFVYQTTLKSDLNLITIITEQIPIILRMKKDNLILDFGLYFIKNNDNISLVYGLYNSNTDLLDKKSFDFVFNIKSDLKNENLKASFNELYKRFFQILEI